MYLVGWGKYGRFSTVRVLMFIPDPGVLNYCMHTFPGIICWIIHRVLTNIYMYLDVAFETLSLKLCELKLHHEN